MKSLIACCALAGALFSADAATKDVAKTAKPAGTTHTVTVSLTDVL